MSFPFDCISDFMFFETELGQSDVILIPGASHPQLMEEAAILYHQGIAPFILPSGGATQHVETTEWEFLRNVGMSLGVPPEAILKEDKATNTFENARLSLEVLHKQEIHPKKVVLVCKNYHARRALLTYQFVFPRETIFYVSPVIDKTGTSKDNWFKDEEKIKYVMNELEKVGKYFRKQIPNWVK
ncbi:YdcF family protein [Paenibacillus sp. WQ 127069]|uniref:YdcF family protein n=1 Tax=Paenibacillus baimaensis TaxID=2982185 RepID=A0ABT2UFX0_9BACL|nr:YdcF family protein [Paenibacillus sp. WQ 127069]MCU6793530.1 YdcF family protein [Paenibacillus sp. WQ 127069]